MIRLSVSDRFGALPTLVRSSGTWATPRRITPAADRFAPGWPPTRISPLQARSPVTTSASSLWPLPATAAIPTILPHRTPSGTSRTAGNPASPPPGAQCRQSTRADRGHAPDRQDDRARLAIRPLERLQHGATDHEPGEVRF